MCFCVLLCNWIDVHNCSTYAHISTHWFTFCTVCERDDYFRVLSRERWVCFVVFDDIVVNGFYGRCISWEGAHTRTTIHLYVNMLWCSALKYRQRNSNQHFAICIMCWPSFQSAKKLWTLFAHFRNTDIIRWYTRAFHIVWIRGHRSFSLSLSSSSRTKGNEHMQFSVQI